MPRFIRTKNVNEHAVKTKVKRGDEVVVLAGKEKGRRGKVVSVDSKTMKCIVEGLNEYKKHVKSQPGGQPGGIITIAMPIHLSNVMVIDKTTGKPTRVGRRWVNDRWLRYAKVSDQLIDSE
ncbi:50S ribosomal protein L24 [bacterium]|nr:50S ribosomal protein L24 [bacterium]MCB1220269.1 50S ribosomal protein L24 [bacterium]UNM07929.1 MAG: 50S ribosomal protein L24 [Planctomycetales bacterium]